MLLLAYLYYEGILSQPVLTTILCAGVIIFEYKNEFPPWVP